MNTGTPPDILALSETELDEALDRHFRARSQPAFRVGQVRAWLFEKDAQSFHQMTDLPAAEREALDESFEFRTAEPVAMDQSRDGTVKHLWRLADGETVESVLIPAGQRLSLCISSQAGCGFACAYCATGHAGLKRQLRISEILAQFRGARQYSRESGLGAITSLVFMGMGEPLANRKAVMPALTLLNGAYGFGARRITISTVGVVPGILELARRPEQFGLAVSLSAPDRALRRRLTPIENQFPLPELMEALIQFRDAGGRRISFEYVLLHGINDSPDLACQLAHHAEELSAHVNLIPFNPVPGVSWRPSPPRQVRRFAAVLEEAGIANTIRETRGQDISAACGQLRGKTAAREDPAPNLQDNDTAGGPGGPPPEAPDQCE